MEATMNARLTQRIVQHLLTERCLLDRIIDENSGNRFAVRDEIIAQAECEMLLIELEKEQHAKLDQGTTESV